MVLLITVLLVDHTGNFCLRTKLTVELFVHTLLTNLKIMPSGCCPLPTPKDPATVAKLLDGDTAVSLARFNEL